jgi:hypothetical protein
MNVFEHEHAEKLRVREEAAEEVALGQAAARKAAQIRIGAQ